MLNSTYHMSLKQDEIMFEIVFVVLKRQKFALYIFDNVTAIIT